MEKVNNGPCPKVYLLLYFSQVKHLLNKKLENPKLRLFWHPQCHNYCGDSLNDLWVTVSYISPSLPAALSAHQSRLKCSSPAGLTRSGGVLCQCSSCHPQTAAIIKPSWTGCLQAT